MFIFLSGINAQCLLNFGVFCFKRYENYTVCVCYAIVLVNIFFSLFLFCGEGISVSVDTVLDCRQKSVCAAHLI